jgi:hypothetical protein
MGKFREGGGQPGLPYVPGGQPLGRQEPKRFQTTSRKQATPTVVIQTVTAETGEPAGSDDAHNTEHQMGPDDAGDARAEKISQGEDVGSDQTREPNDPGRAARQDAKEAKAAYEAVRTNLQELRENALGDLEQIDGMIARVNTQIASIDEVLQAGAGQSPGGAFQLMAGQAALADDVEDAEESGQGSGQSFWARIKRWLGRAGRKLWSMISGLVRVKEWSLTGKMGTGVLGFAEASISVTFG